MSSRQGKSLSKMKKKPKKNLLKDRRNFLKFLATGTGSLLVGTLLGSKLGPLLNFKGEDFKVGQDFKNFKVIEEDNGLVFFNKSGKKILTVNQDGSLEIH